jgi:hypothetical protein
MFNRSEIMTKAWVIARRFAGNSETWAQRISRALKSVWWDAQQAARIAARAAADMAAKAAKFAAMSLADLQQVIESMENSDFLGFAGMAKLAEYQIELAQRRATLGAAL